MKPSLLLAGIVLLLFGCASKLSHQYKLTLEMQRSFAGPVMFDTQWSGNSGTLHVVAREKPSAEGLGKIFHEARVPLSAVQLREIESLVAKVDRSLQGRVPGGLDGSNWSLAADVPSGSYRIESWTPSIHSKERRTEGLQTLGEYLWRAAALEGEKVY